MLDGRLSRVSSFTHQVEKSLRRRIFGRADVQIAGKSDDQFPADFGLFQFRVADADATGFRSRRDRDGFRQQGDAEAARNKFQHDLKITNLERSLP